MQKCDESMDVESSDSIFGTICHSHNATRALGKAALSDAKASVAVTDIDGGYSLRSPFTSRGHWGLKCSKDRMPALGLQGLRVGD